MKKYKQEKESSSCEIEDIASLDELVSLSGRYAYSPSKWEISVSWKELFSLISPFSLEYQNDTTAKKIISEVLIEKLVELKTLFQRSVQKISKQSKYK